MGSVVSEMSQSEKDAFTMGSRKRKASVSSISSSSEKNKENKNTL